MRTERGKAGDPGVGGRANRYGDEFRRYNRGKPGSFEVRVWLFDHEISAVVGALREFRRSHDRTVQGHRHRPPDVVRDRIPRGEIRKYKEFDIRYRKNKIESD